MQTMNVVLSDSLNEYILKQVNRYGYENASEYFCELVQADQVRKEKLALEAEVLRGLECQEMIPLTDKVWSEMRETLKERLNARQGTSS